MEVRGGDLSVFGAAGAVGGGDGGGAGLAVPGYLPPLRGAGHRDGVDGGGVAVTVTVVLVAATVTTRPHKYRAFPISTSVDSLLKRPACKFSRSVHSLAVIIWAPGRGVNVNVVRIEGQRLGLHRVRDLAVQHADAADLSIVGNADNTERVVGRGRHLPSTPGPVSVGVTEVIPGVGVAVVIVHICRGERV